MSLDRDPKGRRTRVCQFLSTSRPFSLIKIGEADMYKYIFVDVSRVFSNGLAIWTLCFQSRSHYLWQNDKMFDSEMFVIFICLSKFKNDPDK